jgi:hypothetical protein
MDHRTSCKCDDWPSRAVTPRLPASPAGYATLLADLKARIRETRRHDRFDSRVDGLELRRGIAACPLSGSRGRRPDIRAWHDLAGRCLTWKLPGAGRFS